MRLRDLVYKALGVVVDNDCDVLGISSDSRNIAPGWLFVAIKGRVCDASLFAEQCIANGACFVVTQSVPANVDRSLYLVVSDTRLALAKFLAVYNGGIGKIRFAGVTGTDGKTSTVHYYFNALKTLGYRAAKIGTLGVEVSENVDLKNKKIGGLTSPEPVVFYPLVAELRDLEINDVCLEASSQGLDQRRFDAIAFDIAAITNITSDHIDYHGTYEHYIQSKLRMFRELLSGVAIINLDIPVIKQLAVDLPKVITFGMHHDADVKIVKTTTIDHDTKLVARIMGNEINVRLPVLGMFSIYNIMCATGMLLARGDISLDQIMSALSKTSTPPGRMEIVGRLYDCPIIVDYAHTADALENVLLALRSVVEGRVITVFGCGGNRDRSKRAEMGRIASRYADIVIVTDDNPRFENPMTIRQEILNACAGAYNIGNREEAIRFALSSIRDGDVLLVAGKGEEQTQIIGDKHIPYSDKSVILKYLAEASRCAEF